MRQTEETGLPFPKGTCASGSRPRPLAFFYPIIKRAEGMEFPGSPVVRTLCFHYVPLPRAQIQSLVGDQRPYKLHRAAKNNNNKVPRGPV